jgi:hypothetical protein
MRRESVAPAAVGTSSGISTKLSSGLVLLAFSDGKILRRQQLDSGERRCDTPPVEPCRAYYILNWPFAENRRPRMSPPA